MTQKIAFPGTIAIIDKGWYELLRRQPDLTEVNFWTPSARRAFRAPAGSPFFFKLRAPYNAICGFGAFTRYARLPDWLAWDCFGIANGCRSLTEMQARIDAIRNRIRYERSEGIDPIGCILIVEPVFFAPEAWISQPADWPPRTQTNKTYDLTQGEGRRIWEACLERVQYGRAAQAVQPSLVGEEVARYGSPALVTPRLGQGTFRVAVSEAYSWGCAISGEHSLPTLDAAHIQPYAENGPHDVSNGLLLRADIHRLFDQGYIRVTPDLVVEVSHRLRTDYANGRSYFPFHGARLRPPQYEGDYPAAEFLQWHNERCYRG